MIIRGNVKGDDAKTVTAFEMIFWKIWEFVKNVLLDKTKNNKEEGKSNKGWKLKSKKNWVNKDPHKKEKINKNLRWLEGNVFNVN